MTNKTRQEAGSENERLLRIDQVLRMIPVAKSTWWLGVKNGKFPKPLHLGPRLTCWLESEILDLMKKEG